ncbi:MAG: MoaD/ThiS family protein [Chloroflexi bacterium]|nr:MoaD/ThiS family protein [Chloroflexota bacterium]
MAQVTIEVRSWLARRLAGNSSRREGAVLREPISEGEALRSLLARLIGRDAGFAQVYDLDHDRLTDYAEVVLNGRVADLVGGLDAPLHDGDVVLVLPSFAGGGQELQPPTQDPT